MNTTTSFIGPDVATARDFTRHLAALLREEQGAMVNFLLALAECDGRRLWASLGHASLFDYLHRELKLSRSAAYYRSAAARLVQRYPEIADALAQGQLCLTSLAEIGKVITAANASEILPRFFHRSSREAKEVAAEIAPHPAPPVRDLITVVPSPARPSIGRPATVRAHDSNQFVQALGQTLSLPAAGPRPEAVNHPERPAPDLLPVRDDPDRVEFLTDDLRRLHVTVTKRWLDKLEQVKCALSHSIPDGHAEEVIEAAFDALLEREARRKGLLVQKPRAPRPAVPAQDLCDENDEAPAGKPLPAKQRAPKNLRKAVPARVRREVTARDEARCQAKLHDGTICGSKVRLQLDHVTPASLDGPSTVENVRVLCASHNQLAARRVFGDSLMDLFSSRARD